MEDDRWMKGLSSDQNEKFGELSERAFQLQSALDRMYEREFSDEDMILDMEEELELILERLEEIASGIDETGDDDLEVGDDVLEVGDDVLEVGVDDVDPGDRFEILDVGDKILREYEDLRDNEGDYYGLSPDSARKILLKNLRRIFMYESDRQFRTGEAEFLVDFSGRSDQEILDAAEDIFRSRQRFIESNRRRPGDRQASGKVRRFLKKLKNNFSENDY